MERLFSVHFLSPNFGYTTERHQNVGGSRVVHGATGFVGFGIRRPELEAALAPWAHVCIQV